MKVLFICGSAQPQRCGVGDYSRRLAGELIRQGHQVSIISLMDAEVSDSIIETQMDLNIAVSVLRLPYANGYKHNCTEAKPFLDNFNPDWVSLQYVPFSFHPKGLPVGLSKHLKRLTESRNVHIMFHELWVSMDKSAVIKVKIWGKLQRELILSLVENLNPLVIHTQTGLYKSMLLKYGINAQLLPLFSNISVENNRLKKNIVNSHYENEQVLSMVLFGSIHKNAPVQQFASEIKSYSSKMSKQVRLVLLGRSGKEAERWSETFQKFNMEVISAGEQTEEKISEILSNVDFGISTSAFEMLEKSGSVAAMSQHGLRIICVATGFNAYETKTNNEINGLFKYVAGNLEQFFESEHDLSIASPFDSIVESSYRLIKSFENFTSSK
jgi:hypothetical protein